MSKLDNGVYHRAWSFFVIENMQVKPIIVSEDFALYQTCF